MGLRKLGRSGDEQRAMSLKQMWLADKWPVNRTHSGVSVSQETAMRIDAIYAASRWIADTCAMLPVDTYYRVSGERRPLRPKPLWVEDPDPDGFTRQTFITQWLVSKLLSHAACVRILRSPSGEVLALKVLDPRRVEPRRDHEGTLYYSIDGGSVRLSKRDMIYDAELIKPGQIKGTSKVDELAETWGIARALETFVATFFGNGAHTTGVVTTPDGVTMEQAREIKAAWDESHQGVDKANSTGLLGGGASWVKTSTDPDEAQMLESRDFAILDACRAFRIAPSMMGVQRPGTTGYASREQDAIQFTTFTIQMYLEAIETHLSRMLPAGGFLKATTGALLRTTLTERYAAYNSGMQAGFLSVNDIHRLEDMPPVPGGDVYRVALANINLDAANLSDQQIRVEMAKNLVDAGWEPSAALAAVGLAPMAHTGLKSVQLQSPTDTKGSP